MPTAQDNKDRDFVMDMYLSIKDGSDFRRISQEWDQSDKLVECWKQTKDPNRSNFSIPRAYSTNRAELATIVESLFAQPEDPPYVFRTPTTIPNDVDPAELVMQADLETAFQSNQLRVM